MSLYIAETERLYLRETTPDDAEQAYLLNLDPEVIQYTGDMAFISIEETRKFLENYTHFKMYGFGRWAVIEKTSMAFLGWCGLKYTAELDEYDVGFRFFKKYWNKGYATEAAQCCLQLGFEKFGMQKIVARAKKENLASIRVIEKLGLQFEKELDWDGHVGVLYSSSTPED